MRLLARFASWLRASVQREDFERRMRDEMQAHVELYETDLQECGVSEADAYRQARAEFGSLEARRDECREAVGLRLLDECRADVRYAVRLLARSPGFTLAALVSLGLGIGANTAIFSLIDTVLVKSLPVERPQQLFFVDNSGGKSGGSSGPPYPCFERLRDHNRFLAGIAAFEESRVKVTLDGTPEQWRGQYVSGSYFEMLGVRAVHGRLLTPADDSEFGVGGPDGAVAVISHGLWTRRFGMDPDVLGKRVQVGTDWVTIVGVTPPGFLGLQVGSPIDITVPIMLAGRKLRSTQMWWMSVLARLKPGATVAEARADLDTLFDAYMTDIGIPRDKRDYFSGIELVPAAKGSNALRRDYSEPLLIVMGIVAVVLLIGCANVANLLLARATARQNEMSVRLAIGASRGRLIRQLLTEGLVLVCLGSIAGLLFARWGVAFLAGLIAGPSGGILLSPEFDLRVLIFTAAVSAFAALLFSLAPALRATRVDAAKPATTGMSASRSRVRLGQSLLVVQVTLSVVLLCGAALFLRTMHNLAAVDAGFDREGVLTFQVDATIPASTVPPKTPDEHRLAHARLGAMWHDFTTRVGAMPGVTSAALGTMSPLTGRDRGVKVHVRGGPPPSSKPGGGIHVNTVTAGYFETVGIRVLAGRSFSDRDRASAPRVAILNETAVRAYFPDKNPIGEKVNFPGQPVEDEYEIIGIVRDTRYKNLRTPDERMVYLPLEQALDPLSSVMIAVRGRGDVTRFVPSIRTMAREMIPGGFVTRVATVEERVEASLVRERLLSMLATFFAGLALTLACVGLYGIVAYGVVRRRREIGIRIAIGAQQHSVMWMVIRETLVLVAAGAALGTIVSVALSRYIERQLFGVTPGDPFAIAAAILLLLLVTTAAGYLPARRASRINPVVALRTE